MTDDPRHASIIPQWGCAEISLTSAADYRDPFQEVRLTATFIAPDGGTQTVAGFWDGGRVWRVRFSPDEPGVWHFTTTCSHASDGGLHGVMGRFTCEPPDLSSGGTRFAQHGPVRLSADRRHLTHADGTPFLWMADTAWNGPLLATSEEWEVYLAERARQRFTAVQWVATHWLAAPTGDLHGERAYHGHERISVNPRFFQQLDRKTQRLTESGMLSVPVMLWAATWSSPQVNALNPGVVLPEDQAILLCRYMLARWSAYPVAWILPGDGVYEGEVAERWKRIGRAVFGEDPHAPVTLHPGGLEWPYDAFRDEPWLDFCGYQSGHSDNERTFAWLVGGAPAQGWEAFPTRPVINLEPCYENHIGGPFGFRHDAHAVRRALYWSLLNAPTAGVSYGGHGVWGWDDGTQPPTNHPSTGVPLPWRKALLMPGAEQIAHLVATLESIAWWRLRPAPGLVATQPGTARTADSRNFIAAAQSAEGDLALVYIPTGGVVELDLRGLTSDLLASWINPRTGAREPVIDQGSATLRRFATPTEDDWLLLFSKG